MTEAGRPSGRYDPDAMPTSRRARPTIRCLVEDLGLPLQDDVDLGQLDHPWLEELRRVAPHSPRGQKRILAIEQPLVFRLRVPAERGATWVDEEHNIVWLCGVERRQDASQDDAYAYFAGLHAAGRLLPLADDRLRDQVEGVTRLQHGLRATLSQLADDALGQRGTELRADLGDYLPCRVLVLERGGVEEIWCALSTRAVDGSHVLDRLRDILFADLEAHFPGAVFETRADWPTGELAWWEVVRFGLR